MTITKLNCVIYSADDRILVFKTCHEPIIWTPTIRAYLDDKASDSQIVAVMKSSIFNATSLKLEPFRLIDNTDNKGNRDILFVSKINKTFRISTKAYIDICPLSLSALKDCVNKKPTLFTYDAKNTLSYIGDR